MGPNLHQTMYAANPLNQYTNVITPGYQSIIGAALATNSVTVSNILTGAGGLADRKIEYFHRELVVGNTGGPLWQTAGVVSDGVTNTGGRVFPAASQPMIYDLDGNLTFDGVWTYQWNCENRLASMTMSAVSGVADSNRLQLTFAYDYLGRRVSKTVSNWNSPTQNFESPVTTLFVYDGWNLIAILDAQSTLSEAFMWGQDLSGTEDGAGGIGGLLAVFEMSSNVTPPCHFVGYDGNGNVTSLIAADDQTISARYEYSPYGELLRATGPMASCNPFRFSTKFADDASGIVYYGARYYMPAFGRWITRDPTEEEGGVHLYTFAGNDGIGSTDSLGCSKDDPWPTDIPKWFLEIVHTEKNLGNVPIQPDGNVSNSEIRKLYKTYCRQYGRKAQQLGHGGNKRRTWTRTRGAQGFVDSRLIIAGGAVTAATIAVTYFSAKMALQDVRAQMAAGQSAAAGSPESNLFDFVRHADAGDNAAADLDAITYVIASGHTGADALVSWSAIVGEEK